MLGPIEADPAVRDLPVLSLLGGVLFPGMRCRLHLQSPRSIRAIEAALEQGGAQVGVFAVGSGFSVDPEPEELCRIGTAAGLLSMGRSECGRQIVELEGLRRIRSLGYRLSQPYRHAIVEGVDSPVTAPPRPELHLLAAAICLAARELQGLLPECRSVARAADLAHAATRPDHVPGVVEGLLTSMSPADRQRLLELDDFERLTETLAELRRRIGFLSLRRSGLPLQQ